MPLPDESAIRKAASWQDFKEAQALLTAGAVISSEETTDGWQGSVKSGKRTFRTLVTTRTRTWFDAKCPCPGNQREGNFCPHAIATGLHLLDPPKKAASAKDHSTPENAMPELSWAVRLQGSWQKSLEKCRLSASISQSDREPTVEDSQLTAWLVSQLAISRPPLQLSLSSTNLCGFLSSLIGHPDVSDSSSAISIDSGTQIQLDDCTLTGGIITMIPARQKIVRIGSSFWKISEAGISIIGDSSDTELMATIFTTLAEGKHARIPLPVFLKRLDLLQEHLDFTSSEWFGSLQLIPAKPNFDIIVIGSASGISAEIHVTYAEPVLPCLIGETIHTRNPTEEAKALSTPPLRDGSFSTSDPDAIRRFLTESLRNFPTSWKKDLAPTVRKLASSFVFISPNIKIVSSGDDWLEFELNYETDAGAPISAAEVSRILRSKRSGYNQLSNSPNLFLSEEIENLINPLFEELDLRQENSRFTSTGPTSHIIQEICINSQKSGIKNPLGEIECCPIPDMLQASLRPYQKKGYSWLIDRLNRYGGALLADDMGLGKTIQTIACIEQIFTSSSQPKPALVVVTTSLLGNWQAEFKRFVPLRRVVVLHGTHRDKLRSQIRKDDVILTTYGTLARDLAWHLRQEYSTVVIDEASLIRNPATDYSKAVARLNATNRIALTGTPVENSVRDLWSIFRFIQPGWLGSLSQFKERYETPISSLGTAPQAATLLRLKTSPFVLRRTKSEVAPELPSKIHIDEYCTLSKEQLATYRDFLTVGRQRVAEIRDSGQVAAARMQTLTTLLRLRQICCDLSLLDSETLRSLPIPRRSAKLERLLEITEQSIASGSRILVFSQFQKQLVEIGKAFGELGIDSLRLDGKTQNRQELVDRFQSISGPPVFLISLKAGGYGLNLTAADVVIHFDPWWNPAAEAQATDRAHRIGQTKPVTVYRLLTRGTVEEKVVHLQYGKKKLADSLDESSTSVGEAPAWSSSDLEKLLSD